LFAISILVLGASPYFQILLISISSFSIIIFYIHVSPHKDRKQRFLDILSEGCFFLAITGAFIILKSDLHGNILEFIGWSMSAVIYISMVVPFLFDIFDLLKRLYQLVFRRCISVIRELFLRTGTTIASNNTIDK
jgi:hypothetical protein